VWQFFLFHFLLHVAVFKQAAPERCAGGTPPFAGRGDDDDIAQDPQCSNPASLRDDGPWELAVIATNVGDERYVYPVATGKPLGAPGDLTGVVGPPREVTLQVTWRF
jgi:hypothetical protein